MAEMSARSTLRAWIKDAIQGQDEISIPELTTRAIEKFSTNAEFLQSLAREAMPGMVAEVSRLVMSQNRYVFFGNKATTRENLPHFIANSVRDVGREVVDEANAQLSAAQDGDALVVRSGEVQSPFLRWYEHAGDRHVALKAMTRSDLILAADERETRGKVELRKAWFLRKLATDLKGEETVGQRFSDDEIRSLWEGMESKPVKERVAV